MFGQCSAIVTKVQKTERYNCVSLSSPNMLSVLMPPNEPSFKRSNFQFPTCFLKVLYKLLCVCYLYDIQSIFDKHSDQMYRVEWTRINSLVNYHSNTWVSALTMEHYKHDSSFP